MKFSSFKKDQLLMESWRRFLKEEEERGAKGSYILTSADEKVVILPFWALDHIKEVHMTPGQGSFFSFGIKPEDLIDTIKKMTISGRTVTTDHGRPTGYDLVGEIKGDKVINPVTRAPIEGEMQKSQKSRKVGRPPEEEEVEFEVNSISTPEPLENFKTNRISFVMPETDNLDYVTEDVKENPLIKQAFEEKKLYTIVSTWPGEIAPPAHEWGNKYAVIIPQGEVEGEES